MNISIVIAVYNESENISRLLDSISRLRQHPSQLEVCIVNDGSTDKTEAVIKEWQNHNFQIKTVYKALPINVGRRMAREIAARLANYQNILITDARCELLPDVLEQLERLDYEPLNGNAITNNHSDLSRVFFLIRQKLFPGSIGEDFPDFLIDRHNFDRTGKGTTIFFIDRERFLRNQTKESGPHVNEDTAILANIIKEKPILKTSKVRCLYWQRDFLQECLHLFHRGPRFIYYYYEIGKPYFKVINLGLVALFITLILSFTGFASKVSLCLIVIYLLTCLYFSKGIKDFSILVVYLPPLILCFGMGILKGLFLKIFRLY